MIIGIFSVIILIFSVILHEYGHAFAAYKLGDSTAKDAGRLTLNPIPHIDLFGSILLPLFFIFSGLSFMIAWAKPVPYNPNNIRDKKYGDLKVAIAGPASNFALAIFFGLIARFIPLAQVIKTKMLTSFLSGDLSYISAQISGDVISSVFLLSIMFCFFNLLLGIFNLIPIPPLDGSKIIANFLPEKLKYKLFSVERYGFFIILILVSFGFFQLLFYPILYSLLFLVGIN